MTVTTSAKVSALDAISASTVVTTDVWVVVDVSDATMGAGGTNFKVQTDQLASTVAKFLPASSVQVATVIGFGVADRCPHCNAPVKPNAGHLLPVRVSHQSEGLTCGRHEDL